MSGIVLFGLVVGWAAQFILDRDGQTTDWTMAIIAGLGGSFVGGLLFSPIAGDGLSSKPSGLIARSSVRSSSPLAGSGMRPGRRGRSAWPPRRLLAPGAITERRR